MIPGVTDILAHYSQLQPATLEPFAKPGFSGAAIIRLYTTAGVLCLRGWPPEMTAASLSMIHALLDQARSLPFVPRLVRTRDNHTMVAAQGRLWEIQTWMPGQADFQQHPSRQRLQAACVALARVHQVWAPMTGLVGRCPAVLRRLATLSEWNDLAQSGWRPDLQDRDPVAPWARVALTLLPALLADAQTQLQPWQNVEVRLQPCLCDPWHDHVLFSGEEVTGLIDYGSVKLDNPAVDLARLLGSLIGDDAALREAGMRAYASVRPFEGKEEWLVSVLDRTGTLLAMVNWLRWLYHEHRPYPDHQAVAGRLAQLVGRVQKWSK